MANIKSFPNNQDTYVGAEWFMRWFHGRTSGVFGADGNAAVVAVQDAMAVTVSDGLGWLSNSEGDGIVWWNDNEKVNGSKLQLSLDLADGSLPRIDRVVVSWQTTNYVALPTISILKGTAASTPVAPSLTNSNVMRQISLAQIFVGAGVTSISAANVTDERLDKTVCGLVSESITADTSTINGQFQAFLTAIEEELQDIEAGVGVELKKLQFNDTVVAASAFAADDTYDNYPYRATIPLAGVLSTMIPEVVFGLAEAISGQFAPIAETYTSGIYIYTTDAPQAAITIPTIICWKGNA